MPGISKGFHAKISLLARRKLTSALTYLEESVVLIRTFFVCGVLKVNENLLHALVGLPSGGSASLSFSRGYKGTTVVSLVLLLPWVVRATLAGAFITLRLALGTVEDHPNWLLA
jgi:hypothetical protein